MTLRRSTGPANPSPSASPGRYPTRTLVPLALWLGEGAVERALLIGSLLGVVVVELLNSGIEAVVDRIGQERHELSGRAKDIGSAAVFVALLNAAIVWLLILL